MSTRGLVPDTPGPTPNYWCTWNLQNFAAADGATVAELEGSSGSQRVRNCLVEGRVFGPDGWLARCHPRARADLRVVFDDGWDLPIGEREDLDPWFGSLELNQARFPSCTGDPGARLTKLNAMVRAAGWRGTGLWVCAQEAPRAFSGWHPLPAEREAYWRERLRWCRQAGVDYWKVDWGKYRDSEEVRRLMTCLAREEAPDLVIEHTVCRWPMNAWETTGRLSPELLAAGNTCIAYSDVFRTYDILTPLSVPTTLERVGRHLATARAEDGVRGLLQCEDEATIAAVLGCVMGIMRHPIRPHEADWPALCYGGPRFAPTRPLAYQHDEVARAVRWQRLAPAFGVNEAPALLDDALLWDTWTFARGEITFDPVLGETCRQGAPARIARGMALPTVEDDGEPPYVIAARHPNGAVAVGTLGRVTPDRGYRVPPAHVTLPVGDAPGPIGVFGEYRALTLTFARPVSGHILAQDLLADRAEDITDRVERDGTRITLDGALIRAIGLSAAAPGDRSEPGLVLAIAD